MQIIFSIILGLGIVGVIRGAIRFFILGRDAQRAGDAYDLIYKDTVNRTADSLILIVGALVLLWLVQSHG